MGILAILYLQFSVLIRILLFASSPWQVAAPNVSYSLALSFKVYFTTLYCFELRNNLCGFEVKQNCDLRQSRALYMSYDCCLRSCSGQKPICHSWNLSFRGTTFAVADEIVFFMCDSGVVSRCESDLMSLIVDETCQAWAVSKRSEALQSDLHFLVLFGLETSRKKACTVYNYPGIDDSALKMGALQKPTFLLEICSRSLRNLAHHFDKLSINSSICIRETNKNTWFERHFSLNGDCVAHEQSA